MTDTRELILARIRQILDTVPGIAVGNGSEIRGAGRNRDHISAKARPMVILYDGTEELVELPNSPRHSMVQLMRLLPDITIFIGDTTEDVGTRFSAFRAYLLTTILQDPTLVDLTGGPGAQGLGGGLTMRYEGCDFSTETGAAREGSMTLHLSFIYVLRVADLMA